MSGHFAWLCLEGTKKEREGRRKSGRTWCGFAEPTGGREEERGERREKREKEQKGEAEKAVPSVREGDLPRCQNILDAPVPSGSNLHFALFCF